MRKIFLGQGTRKYFQLKDASQESILECVKVLGALKCSNK